MLENPRRVAGGLCLAGQIAEEYDGEIICFAPETIPTQMIVHLIQTEQLSTFSLQAFTKFPVVTQIAFDPRREPQTSTKPHKRSLIHKCMNAEATR